MADGTVEIIDGNAPSPTLGITEKLRIVTKSQEPSATVRAVAARHDVYPSLRRT